MVFKKLLPIESYPGESKLFLNNQVNKILLDQTFFLNFEGLVRSPWSILYNKSEYNRQFLQVLSSILSSVLHRHKSHATYVRMLLLKRTSLKNIKNMNWKMIQISRYQVEVLEFKQSFNFLRITLKPKPPKLFLNSHNLKVC